LKEIPMVRKLSAMMGCMILSLTVAACSDSSSSAKKKVIEREGVTDSIFKPKDLETTVNNLVAAIAETDATEMRMDINLKSLSGYWDPIVVGANRAMSELDVTGDVSSPQKDTGDEAIQEQVQMLKDAREAGTNGIAVAPFETPATEEINAASDAGIPVVTIDSDLPDSKRDLYVGTLNDAAGKTGGETLVEYLPSGGGTVIILGHDDPGWPAGYARSMGAKEVLEDAGYTVVVRRTDWTTEGEDLDLTFLADAIANADPPVVGMIGMFSNAYRCAMAAEAASLTADDVAIVAFDFDAKTVGYMESGLIRATHAQRQYYMGYLTPYVLYGMNVLGKEDTLKILDKQVVDGDLFNAGLDIVAGDQLDEYYSFLDDLGVGG
jgi:ribose transport system substrate-binding protein